MLKSSQLDPLPKLVSFCKVLMVSKTILHPSLSYIHTQSVAIGIDTAS